MENGNIGRKILKPVRHRRKLSDISNTPILLNSRIDDENGQLVQKESLAQLQGDLFDISITPVLPKSRIDDEDAQLVQKGSLAQLQEELLNAKKMVAEKEKILAENKRHMKIWWLNYCRKSKQNDEIILHNSQLSKDLMQVQEQFKVLQHENAQMSAVYKACKAEMQIKLDEALTEVDRLTILVEASSLKQASDKHCPPSIVPGHSKGDNAANSKLEFLRQIDGDGTCQNESIQHNMKVAISKPSRGKGVATIPAYSASCKSEVATIPAYSASCKSEVPTAAVENRAHTKASRQCTEKGQIVSKPESVPLSTHEPADRPRRKAASSIGSYKERPLKTKMRRVEM